MANLANLLAAIQADLPYLASELALTGGIVITVLTDLFSRRQRPGLLFGIMAATVTLSALLTLPYLNEPPHDLFSGLARLDHLAAYVKLLFSAATILAGFLSLYYPPLRAASDKHEYFVFMLGLQLAAQLLAMAHHLLFAWAALEFVSLCSYLLTAYLRQNAKAAEAALKYLIYGSFASAVMLYGVSWCYGLSGNLHLSAGPSLLDAEPQAALTALALVMAGVAFKIAAVPFHFWAPDVYEGAPTPVAALLSTTPKIAGFVLLLRLLAVYPPESLPHWQTLLAVMAMAMMCVGNLAALRQKNILRLLAYSGIAHAGYLLMGALAGGLDALLYYFGVYVVMNFGAFGVAMYLSNHSANPDEWRGLALPRSVVAGVVVVMASLTGLPPTAGFFAKLFLFIAVWLKYYATHDPIWLTLLVCALVNTVISFYYYLRIPMLMLQPAPLRPFQTTPALGVFLIILSAFLLLAVFVSV